MRSAARAALALIGVVLALAPMDASATHEEPNNRCFTHGSDRHGTNGPENITDGLNNHLDLVLAAGNDFASGRDRTDHFCGQADPDDLRGGDGNDGLNGGQGADDLFGNNGNDRLNGGDGTNDFCDGGPGTDSFESCEMQMG